MELLNSLISLKILKQKDINLPTSPPPSTSSTNYYTILTTNPHSLKTLKQLNINFFFEAYAKMVLEENKNVDEIPRIFGERERVGERVVECLGGRVEGVWVFVFSVFVGENKCWK